MSKQVFKNSLFYMISSLLPTFIGFIMLPIYTRYLSPADYGVVALVISLQSFLPLVMTFQVHNSISRFYFDYYKNEQKLKIFFSTIFFITLCLSLLSMSLLIYFLDDILYFLFPILI